MQAQNMHYLIVFSMMTHFGDAYVRSTFSMVICGLIIKATTVFHAEFNEEYFYKRNYAKIRIYCKVIVEKPSKMAFSE
jgi:hypothetical protein